MALGDIHGATTTFVVLRIGWCQQGENSPATLSAARSLWNTSWTAAAAVRCRRHHRHHHRHHWGSQWNNPRTRRRTRRGTSACGYQIGISSPTFPLPWILKFRRRSQRPAGGGRGRGRGRREGHAQERQEGIRPGQRHVAQPRCQVESRRHREVAGGR